jgi:hypothetical protein
LKRGQVKIDEFAYVLLAGLLLIVIMMIVWSALPQELPPMVTPPSVSLSLSRGSSASFIFTINATAAKITLDPYGDIKDWLNFDKNFFALGGSTDVKVTVVAPADVTEGVHTGYITVSSAGGNRTVYVNVNVLKFSATDIPHPIYFNDFTVSYTLGSDIIASKEDVDVAKGTFTNQPVSLVNDPLPDDKFSIVTSGFISIVVDDTNSGGNLIVELNGKEVFRRTVGSGEISIPLDKSQINKTNTVNLRTESPGWKFWMSTVYKIKSVKLGINYLGISSQEKTFSLDAIEVSNFRYARVTFRVKNYLLPQQNLVIKINNQTVYMDVPSVSIFREDFRDDIFGNPLSLNAGQNTLSFSLENEGFYDLGDVTLIVVRSTQPLYQ